MKKIKCDKFGARNHQNASMHEEEGSDCLSSGSSCSGNDKSSRGKCQVSYVINSSAAIHERGSGKHYQVLNGGLNRKLILYIEMSFDFALGLVSSCARTHTLPVESAAC